MLLEIKLETKSSGGYTILCLLNAPVLFNRQRE